MGATPVKRSSPGPDEWHHLEDLNERRRVQNRLSQRNRRTNLRNQQAQGQIQSQKRETTKKASESAGKQNRQLFWVQPNTSTARGKLVTTKRQKPELPRPQDPGPMVTQDCWPEIWDSSLHEVSAGERLHNSLESGDVMETSWIDSLMLSPVLPIENDVLGCTSPVPIFDTTVTFDVAPSTTIISEKDGSSSQADLVGIQGQDLPMIGTELGHTTCCNAPRNMQSTMQPQSQTSDSSIDRDDRDNFFGYAALHMAASRGHLPIVQLLTEKGMPVDQLSSENETALHVAVGRGHFAVARYLLERGAEPHRGNQHGQTALHVAAEQGHCDIVRLLFSYLGDLNVLDHNGQTALHRAVAEGHVEVVRLLLERGMNAEMKVGCPLGAKP
ncbi:ankyrin repeat domain-containing protein [Aspergillus mulundensis]|uniref:Uncharacterized protein n=1 Tax=Aspergillus mulundensis TaxID=1810919 RepID=A0A3D8SX05_9EURO|nr:hypothetical protein DSM5745_02083 [Aspergillus mulundensis]RDW90308.1 hypothetical protein DSM5745_02083 [Aspergillus mulundensis]